MAAPPVTDPQYSSPRNAHGRLTWCGRGDASTPPAGTGRRGRGLTVRAGRRRPPRRGDRFQPGCTPARGSSAGPRRRRRCACRLSHPPWSAAWSGRCSCSWRMLPGRSRQRTSTWAIVAGSTIMRAERSGPDVPLALPAAVGLLKHDRDRVVIASTRYRGCAMFGSCGRSSSPTR